VHQEQLDDEDRFRFMLKMASRLKDIEDQVKQNTNAPSSTFYGANGLMSNNPIMQED
jgi:hypothetical protein